MELHSALTNWFKSLIQDFFQELDDRRANIIDVLKVIERYRAEGKIAPVQKAAQDRIISQDTKMFTIQDGVLSQNKLDGKSYRVKINGDLAHQPAKKAAEKDDGRTL